ncbi:MAG: hypothetical protein U0941_15950 [Planctomycetaceae bacterium]
MIRKVMHLVRTVELNDEMEVVVETTDDEVINEIEPANLWAFFIAQKISPEVVEELDEGVEIHLGEYAPDKHGDLPIVDVTASAPANVATKNRVSVLSEPRPDLIQMAVTLTRHVMCFEVIRAIVQGPTLESIHELDANDLWWNCSKSGVLIEKAEQWEPEVSIEYETYVPDKHIHLPFVTLPKTFDFENGPTILAESTRWNPFTKAKQKDELESDRVGDMVNVEANECYFNARRVIRSLPDYYEASYVEGFVVTEKGECFEHGWIVKDGKIVDPTLPHGDDSYFPALEFVGQVGIRQFLSTHVGNKYSNRPFHQAFGWNPGIECQDFLHAFKAAMKYLSAEFGDRAVEEAFRVRIAKQLPWTDEWR